MRHTVFFALIAMMAIFFVGVPGVSAQTEVTEEPTIETTAEPVEVEEETKEDHEELEEEFFDGDVSEEALEDEDVSPEELGAEEAAILPDNLLYGFKRIGRAVRRAVTFDPAKKAELDITFANQELVDVQKMVELRGERSAGNAAKSIERIEKRLSRASELPEIAEEKRAKLLERFVGSEIPRQKVLDAISDTVEDPTVSVRVEEARERIIEHVGEAFEEVEVDEQFFERVLERAEGGEFKDLRNLEVLKRVELQVPDQAKEAIRRAQNNAFKRIRNKVEEFDNDDRERFGDYLRDFRGDHVVKFELLDEFEEEFEDEAFAQEMKVRIKRAQDKAAQAFEDAFEALDERIEDDELREEIRERMMHRFREGDALDERRFERIEEFRSRIELEELEAELEETEEEEIARFVEAFPDASADVAQYERLKDNMREAVSSGNIAEVKVLQKAMDALEAQVKADPAKRAFLQQMEEVHLEAQRGFAQRVQREGDDVIDDLISEDPEHIEFLRELKERFQEHRQEGESFGNFDPAFFDRAFHEQEAFLSEEELRRERELEREEREFRKQSELRREELRLKLEEQLREVDGEEREELEQAFREKEEAFREAHDARERELFEQRIRLECDSDTCRETMKAEYDIRMRFDNAMREQEESFREIRDDAHENAREHRREAFEHTDEGANPFAGVCEGAAECESWCQDHKDDPKCVAAGKNDRFEAESLREFRPADTFSERVEVRDGEERVEFRREIRNGEIREEIRFRNDEGDKFRSDFREEDRHDEQDRDVFEKEVREDFRSDDRREAHRFEERHEDEKRFEEERREHREFEPKKEQEIRHEPPKDLPPPPKIDHAPAVVEIVE